jgi:hypothetical protein
MKVTGRFMELIVLAITRHPVMRSALWVASLIINTSWGVVQFSGVHLITRRDFKIKDTIIWL